MNSTEKVHCFVLFFFHLDLSLSSCHSILCKGFVFFGHLFDFFSIFLYFYMKLFCCGHSFLQLLFFSRHFNFSFDSNFSFKFQSAISLLRLFIGRFLYYLLFDSLCDLPFLHRDFLFFIIIIVALAICRVPETCSNRWMA